MQSPPPPTTTTTSFPPSADNDGPFIVTVGLEAGASVAVSEDPTPSSNMDRFGPICVILSSRSPKQV